MVTKTQRDSASRDTWQAAEAGDIVRLKAIVAARHEEFGYPARESLQARDPVLEAMPLHFAVEKGHLETVQYLLSQNVDPHPYDSYQVTPLHVAAAKGHLDIMEVLLAQHVDVRLADGDGDTPLHWAATKGHVPCMAALIAKAARVDVPNKKGWTPLHRAAYNGRCDAITLLLQHKAAVLQVTGDAENTPLHLAAMNNMYRAVELLLGWGARLDLKNKEGQTAREVCNDNALDLIERFERKEEGVIKNNTAAADASKGVRKSVAPQKEDGPGAPPRLPAKTSSFKPAVLRAMASIRKRNSGAFPMEDDADFEPTPAKPTSNLLAMDESIQEGSEGGDSHLDSYMSAQLKLTSLEDRPRSGKAQLPSLGADVYSVPDSNPGGRDMPHPWLRRDSITTDREVTFEGAPEANDDDYQERVRNAARKKSNAKTQEARLLKKSASLMARSTTPEGRESLPQRNSSSNGKFLNKYGLSNKGLFSKDSGLGTSPGL